MIDVPKVGPDPAVYKKITEILTRPPARAILMDLDNGVQCPMLFNPNTFNEQYSATYARHGSPGNSYERMHYMGNPNPVIEVPFYVDIIAAGDRFQTSFETINQARIPYQSGLDAVHRFLVGALYPRKYADSPLGSSPASLYFHWPGHMDIRVKITSVSVEHSFFLFGSAEPRIALFNVTMEEVFPRRITREDVMFFGSRRPWAADSLNRENLGEED